LLIVLASIWRVSFFLFYWKFGKPAGNGGELQSRDKSLFFLLIVTVEENEQIH
jgi:hypothetical protein